MNVDLYSRSPHGFVANVTLSNDTDFTLYKGMLYVRDHSYPTRFFQSSLARVERVNFTADTLSEAALKIKSGQYD